MSKERELLIGAVEWMHELKYVLANVRDSGDYDLLELIADINNIELLLAQTEQNIAGAVMPNGVCVSNVYDAYEAGRASVLLAQPEQTQQTPVACEPVISQDLINDIEYLITAFETSADADDYWRPISDLIDDLSGLKKREQPPITQREMYQRGYAAAERDLKRKPLSDAAIMLLGKQNLCLEASAFKPFGFARAIEKAHGIGVGE